MWANNRVYYGPMVNQAYVKVWNFYNTWQVHSVACVSKIRSILTAIFREIYEVVCIQITHLSDDDFDNTCTLSYHHHD